MSNDWQGPCNTVLYNTLYCLVYRNDLDMYEKGGCYRYFNMNYWHGDGKGDLHNIVHNILRLQWFPHEFNVYDGFTAPVAHNDGVDYFGSYFCPLWMAEVARNNRHMSQFEGEVFADHVCRG